MANVFTRMWRYLGAAFGGRFEERADPKVQLEQAIAEAQDQHRRLKEQAANVIANQKQTELRLERSLQELEKLNANAQQALLMADEARRSGDDAKAAEYEQAAESIATRLVAVEQEVEDLRDLHLDAVRSSEQAKESVAQNAEMLEQRLAEKQELLSQLDRARMTEQMNEAMTSLGERVGQDVPTFEEVRAKIEGRMARAQGRAELEGHEVRTRTRKVEQASRNVAAQKRLSELRSQLGLADAEQPAAAAPTPAELTPDEGPTEAAPEAATEPPPAEGRTEGQQGGV